MTKAEYDKARFDSLKKVTKGRSSIFSNPTKGKNRLQRQRLGNAFRAMEPKRKPISKWPF